MKRSEMMKQLEAGKDPLELSIEKWKDIVNEKGENLGPDNCALCEVYQRVTIGGEFLPYSERCKSCPIMDRTGQQFCEGTPYPDVLFECGKDAQPELDFLVSLRNPSVLPK